MTLKEASRIFYFIHSDVQRQNDRHFGVLRQDDRHCGVQRQDDIYCGVQRFRDKMKDTVECRDAEIG